MSNRSVNRTTWWWAAPEYFSKWRIFPRLFLSLYMWMLYQMTIWFIALEDPTTAQAGFVSVVVGAGAAWFGLYVNSGGDGRDPAAGSALTPARRALNEDDLQRAVLPIARDAEVGEPSANSDYQPRVVARQPEDETES